MDAFQAYLQTARYSERQAMRFIYLEQFRHGPNFAGKVWLWIDGHYYSYLAFLVAAVFLAANYGGDSVVTRSISGAVVSAVVLAPAFAGLWFWREPCWQEPRALPLSELEHLHSGPDLLADPNLVYEEQVFKFKGDPDALALAHILWLRTVSPTGKLVKRAIIMWSAHDSAYSPKSVTTDASTAS